MTSVEVVELTKEAVRTLVSSARRDRKEARECPGLEHSAWLAGRACGFILAARTLKRDAGILKEEVSHRRQDIIINALRAELTSHSTKEEK